MTEAPNPLSLAVSGVVLLLAEKRGWTRDEDAEHGDPERCWGEKAGCGERMEPRGHGAV